MTKRAPREHLFVETDGQVYLVCDRGAWRFPRAGERLPFPASETARMDFGTDVVVRMKPKLAYHPEEWFLRDDLYGRDDVDPLVTRAVYMTMGRIVAEVVVARGGKILMEHSVRGFSKGHWNLPGGFLDFGESPEAGARREAEEEIGVPVRIDGLLDAYVSAFPGKPAYSYGFVFHGDIESEDFHLKADEVDEVGWFPAWRCLELTRNPFARWGIVDAYRRGLVPPIRVPTHRPPEDVPASRAPVVFLDRDGVINRGRVGYVRKPSQFTFLPGAKAAMKTLNDLGYRLAVISNQDPLGWKILSHEGLRKIHDRMLRELEADGVRVENVYYCPHAPREDCPCHKPRPGLLLAACKDLDARPKEAWMVGDKVGDVLAGKAVGARAAFVGDARRRARFAKELREAQPDLAVASLAAFAEALHEAS